MIGFIFALLTIFFVALEFLSIEQAKKLSVSCEVDKNLVEPGEINTLCYTISSRSRFPFFFVSTAIYFEKGITVREDEEFCRKYVSESFFNTSVSHYIRFVPHGRYKGAVRFSVEERGLHSIGRIYVETGDFFGLRTSIASEELTRTVICTARTAEDDTEITALGSYLGDISVRRFIFEDPNLLIGYREYTGREPMKKISWTQSAKSGKLMVKCNDYTVDIHVAVVVNMEKDRDPAMERCLSLARTACEYLEDRKIPYALLTNGDLGELTEGMGRRHLNAILRRIGVSRPAGYESFASLVDRCIRTNRDNRSFIIVTPEPDALDKAQLRRLQQFSDSELCILIGRGEENEGSDRNTACL